MLSLISSGSSYLVKKRPNADWGFLPIISAKWLFEKFTVENGSYFIDHKIKMSAGNVSKWFCDRISYASQRILDLDAKINHIIGIFVVTYAEHFFNGVFDMV